MFLNRMNSPLRGDLVLELHFPLLVCLILLHSATPADRTQMVASRFLGAAAARVVQWFSRPHRLHKGFLSRIKKNENRKIFPLEFPL